MLNDSLLQILDQLAFHQPRQGVHVLVFPLFLPPCFGFHLIVFSHLLFLVLDVMFQLSISLHLLVLLLIVSLPAAFLAVKGLVPILPLHVIKLLHSPLLVEQRVLPYLQSLGLGAGQFLLLDQVVVVHAVLFYQPVLHVG